jgi:ubiquinone/menaquinone biosynthesis C-methylase UbiE
MTAFMYSNVIDRILRGVRRSVPEFCGMRPGESALDVCCATGAQALCYASHGLAAAGVDSDRRLIDFASRSWRARGPVNASFHLADARYLPFRGGCFDYVSVSFALHEKDPETRYGLISEMKRVAREQGSLVFIDFAAPLPGNAFSYMIELVELLAGREHHRWSREFRSGGGLEALLEEHALREEKREYRLRGNVALVLARNPENTGRQPQV